MGGSCSSCTIAAVTLQPFRVMVVAQGLEAARCLLLAAPRGTMITVVSRMLQPQQQRWVAMGRAEATSQRLEDSKSLPLLLIVVATEPALRRGGAQCCSPQPSDPSETLYVGIPASAPQHREI